MVRVWDPLVRVFHWSLVTGFVIAWLTAEELSLLHEWSGYVIAGLIGLRLLWGLIGSHYARFTQFVRGPGMVMNYLKALVTGREKRYLGHNPAGAAMIIALLITLLATAYTGWLTANPTRLGVTAAPPSIVSSALADDDGDDDRRSGDKWVKEVHEALANLMLVLAGLHIGGIVLTSYRHRENLARAMVTGNKRAAEPGDVF